MISGLANHAISTIYSILQTALVCISWACAIMYYDFIWNALIAVNYRYGGVIFELFTLAIAAVDPIIYLALNRCNFLKFFLLI